MTNISINIKTSKEQKEININQSSSVENLKKLVAPQFNIMLQQVCLIFAGKILKDEQILDNINIKNGVTVHLVIKSLDQETLTSESSKSKDATTNLFQNFNISPDLNNMQTQLQQELTHNPNLMQQILNNPLVSGLMNNTDLLQNLLSTNPQMQSIIERNPELGHLLNNSELMKETMELARNPAMLQEMMRNQDRALSNIESIPGGYNLLRRMYTDIQEPLLNAASEQLIPNPFDSLKKEGGSEESKTDVKAAKGPMPNPWNAGGNATASNSDLSSSSGSGLLGAPAMQNFLQTMLSNPSFVDIVNSPNMAASLKTLSDNPELYEKVLMANPLFKNNPKLGEEIKKKLPMLSQQMQNPEIMALMTNPKVMKALAQIQEGMMVLQQEAPSLMPGLGTPLTSLSHLNSFTGSDFSSLASVHTDGGKGSSTDSDNADDNKVLPAVVPQQQQQNINQFMLQMLDNMSIPATRSSASTNLSESKLVTSSDEAEKLYQSQLNQLNLMGFINKEENVKALIATLGDVNSAIDLLIQQQQI